MHTCNHCKKEFEWGEESVWFGSQSDVDGGSPFTRVKDRPKPIVKACSDSCGQYLWGEDYKDDIFAG